MNDEKLIRLVGEYPVLYDSSNPKYMDWRWKLDIWNDIGKKMKVDGLQCRSRWINIRNGYRKSLRRNTKNGQGAKETKVYKYSKQLGFLKRHFYEKITKGENIEDDEDQPEQIVKQEPSDQEEGTIEIRPILLQRKSAAFQQIASTKLTRYVITRNECQTVLMQHPVDTFLAGLAPTLKTFNSYYLNLVKWEIFATVQKYDMRNLEQRRSSMGIALNLNRDATLQPNHSSTSALSAVVRLASPAAISHERPKPEDKHTT